MPFPKTPPKNTPPVPAATPAAPPTSKHARVVRLSEATRARLLAHSDKTGLDPGDAVEYALGRWLDAVGTPADPDTRSETASDVTDAPGAAGGRPNPLKAWAMSEKDAEEEETDPKAEVQKYGAARGRPQR